MDKETRELREQVLKAGEIISGEYLKDLIKSKYPKMMVFGMDKSYRMVPLDLAKRLLDVDHTDREKYIPEYNDCDNFALELKVGLSRLGYTAVGALSDSRGKHAYNVLVTNEDVILVEPQTDNIIKPSILGKGHYYMEEGGILI